MRSDKTDASLKAAIYLASAVLQSRQFSTAPSEISAKRYFGPLNLLLFLAS